jgi:hypothetical protein
MLPSRLDLWEDVRARSALETPQVLLCATPAESDQLRLLGYSAFLTGYGARDLSRVQLPLQANSEFRHKAVRSYLAPEDLLPQCSAFTDVEGDTQYLGFVAGHYLYKPGQGSVEDIAHFPGIRELGFTKIRSLAPIAPSYQHYDFRVGSVAFVVEDEEKVVQTLLVDPEGTSRIKLDLSAVLNVGEEVTFVQYMQMNEGAGTMVAIVGTNGPRIMRIQRTDQRAIQVVQAGDITHEMGPPTTVTANTARRITWIPVSGQSDLGDYIVWYPLTGIAQRLRYDTGETNNTLVVKEWDLRALLPIQNLAMASTSAGLLLLFTPDGWVRAVNSTTSAPTDSDVIHEAPVPGANPQDAVFVPTLVDDEPPMSVIYSAPQSDAAEGLPVILTVPEVSAGPHAELDLRSLELAALGGQDGWTAVSGAPQVEEDSDHLSLSGRIVSLVNGDRISRVIPATVGDTLWLRFRVPTTNQAPSTGDGLQVIFSDGGGDSRYFINYQEMGGDPASTPSTPSYPREVGGFYYFDMRVAYRINAAYMTTSLYPFVQIPIVGISTGTPPKKPIGVEIRIIDAPGNRYDLEWLLVAPAACDPIAYAGFQNFLPGYAEAHAWAEAQESLLP